MKNTGQRSAAKKWFGKWAKNYDKTLGKVDRHHQMLELAVAMSKVKDNDRVLDIGCGTGLLSIKFLKKADCSITGTDISKDMIHIYNKKLKHKAKSITGDIDTMKLHKNAYDIAAATVSLHHLKDKYKAVKKIYDALKPKGRFVLGDIDVDTTGRHTDAARLKRILNFLNEEFIMALETGGVKSFKHMYSNGIKHILNDGEYCISFKQWAQLCRRVGFKNVAVKPVKGFEWLKVMTCEKTPGGYNEQQ